MLRYAFLAALVLAPLSVAAQPFPADTSLVEIPPEVLAKRAAAIRQHEADIADEAKRDAESARRDADLARARQEQRNLVEEQERARSSVIMRAISDAAILAVGKDQALAAQQAEIADLKDRLSKVVPAKTAPAFGPTIPSKALSGSDATPN